jgi:outer membrane protein W
MAIALLASPTLAADSHWQIRGFVVWFDPDVDRTIFNADGETIRVESDDDIGFGLSAEYRYSPRFGVEFGVLQASPETTVTLEDSDLGISLTAKDDGTIRPLTAGVNWYLTPQSNLDLYVGAFLAYVLYDDLTFDLNAEIPVNGEVIVVSDRARIDVDNDFSYGAVLGLDIPIGTLGWAVAASVRYIETDLDTTDDDGDRLTLSVDPLIVTLGVRYSF